eukprot:TRINITY_DN13914_c0_g1_i3.p1 TRINITY_DN13914_c0_g1~~TRINITY_DN13914_c0_g1_i3.p1  ORF type:complete len:163 (+),score=6.81 TRINITY_DN13914_c0_g1_i3:276-764(+)
MVPMEPGDYLEIHASITQPRVNSCPKPDNALTANLPEPKDVLTLPCGDLEVSNESVSFGGTRLNIRTVSFADVLTEADKTEISLRPKVEINLAPRSKSSATWSHGCGTCASESDFDDYPYDQSKRFADFSTMFPGALNVARARNLQRYINMNDRNRTRSFGV